MSPSFRAQSPRACPTVRLPMLFICSFVQSHRFGESQIDEVQFRLFQQAFATSADTLRKLSLELLGHIRMAIKWKRPPTPGEEPPPRGPRHVLSRVERPSGNSGVTGGGGLPFAKCGMSALASGEGRGKSMIPRLATPHGAHRISPPDSAPSEDPKISRNRMASGIELHVLSKRKWA